MKIGSYTLAQISDQHFLSDFDCKHDDNRLGEWLSKYAYDEDLKDLSRVWILAKEEQPGVPVGYFSLSDHQLLSSEVQKKYRTGISKTRAHPARLLGKFAVDYREQKSNVSNILMAAVFLTYLNANEYSAARFLVLHTQKPRLVEYYQRFGFVKFESNYEGSSLLISTENIKTYLSEAGLYEED
ncbi:hypothetical protein [Arcanobacterium bovis]|uniref:GNAT family N-acetyltransferase n=1 Tax=Arcanobacterium bovis TaxID=2529275 RepID=A0A4Q9V0I2_9ACTO|nr:hypothetical protein [Arcanobacterium bovis]TBW22138.1 hypothetical protein EZJ44_04745 [Arcanobacterium bovis]